MEEHKRLEQQWYDAAAARDLGVQPVDTVGATTAPPEFRAPYVDFERRVLAAAKPGATVLDVGAGTGIFSLTARGAGRTLIAADISQMALRIARERARVAGEVLLLVCADAERLPFRDHSMDVVTTAGVLYCLDMNAVTKELRRVLRPDGAWVIVDSLNESPIYRLNRWIRLQRHTRTALAAQNVPTTKSLLTLRGAFAEVSLTCHGVLTFLVPLLRPLMGAERAGRFVSAADRRLGWLRHWAFKVVVVARGSPPPRPPAR